MTDKIIQLMKHLYREDGQCYHPLNSISEKLNMQPNRIYDANKETGVLWDLVEDGEILKAGDWQEPSFCYNWDE